MNYIISSNLCNLCAITGTVSVLFLYICLYSVYREKYMGTWIIGWFLLFIRLSLFESGFLNWNNSLLTCVTYQMFFIVSTVIFIYSAHLFIDKPLNKYWLYWAVIASIATVIFALMQVSIFFTLFSSTYFSGILVAYVGYIYIYKVHTKGISHNITGYSFVLWGILTMTTPFFINSTMFLPWILICGILRLVIATSTLMVYFEKTRADLISQQKSLHQTNQELNHFCHSVAHDFKSPLQSINKLSQYLMRDYADKLDRNGQELVNHIKNKSAEVVTITDHLLELSRMSQKQIKTEPVSLEELFWTIYSKLRMLGPQRQVECTIAELPTVQGDPIMLEILVTNILDNALKYTRNREPAIIDVTFSEEEHNYIISVKDNGAGFDMEDSSRLFQILERLHSVDQFEGTGIGLVTCQKILKRHGGKAWMIGKVDEGANFFFSFPKGSSNQPSSTISTSPYMVC